MLEDEFQDGYCVVDQKTQRLPNQRTIMTSQSMRGYKFPNFEIIDAKIASALEQDHLKSVLQKESQPGRTKRSNTRQISSRKTDCSHDLRTFPSYWRS